MITSIEPWEEVQEDEPLLEPEIPDREQEKLDHELYWMEFRGAFKPGELDLDEIDQLDLEAAVRILTT